MRLQNIKQLQEFLNAVNACKGQVWLESVDGDKINLNSQLSQYVALGALLSERGEHLDLYCSDREDESLFLNFFQHYPDTI